MLSRFDITCLLRSKCSFDSNARMDRFLFRALGMSWLSGKVLAFPSFCWFSELWVSGLENVLKKFEFSFSVNYASMFVWNYSLFRIRSKNFECAGAKNLKYIRVHVLVMTFTCARIGPFRTCARTINTLVRVYVSRLASRRLYVCRMDAVCWPLEVHSFAMRDYCVMYLLCDVFFCMCLMYV